MTSRDPYSETETVELDPGLGPIKINSTVLNHEYILVQRITESNPVPLWVSAYRRPFRQAVFLEPMEQAVSLTLIITIALNFHFYTWSYSAPFSHFYYHD